jgi:riboflavin-specific deaminase-like protein
MGRRPDHAGPMKVFSNTAISLDGRINTRERRFSFFGSARDHARMSRLRAEADAVLVGGATFRNWPHPSLPDIADRGRLRGRPWNVVVTTTLDVPLTPEFLGEASVRPLFLTQAASLRPDFPAEAEGWSGDGTRLPVAWMLEQIARRGVERLLVEAGGDLLFQFLAADALDEMHVTLCPLVVGGPAPSLVDGAGFDTATLRRLRLLASEQEGDEIFLQYAVTGKAVSR